MVTRISRFIKRRYLSARSLFNVRQRNAFRQLQQGKAEEYQRYLKLQLDRSYQKKLQEAGLRGELLVQKTTELYEGKIDPRILCIGARNNFEIDCFRAYGYENVVGIDLHSASPDILIMDMHDMNFPENSFDIVYAAHSLEHSFDIHKVVEQLSRVAIDGAYVAVEVPVNYETRGADLIDFGDVEGLMSVFEPIIGEVCYAESFQAETASNPQATDVVRLVFKLAK